MCGFSSFYAAEIQWVINRLWYKPIHYTDTQYKTDLNRALKTMFNVLQESRDLCSKFYMCIVYENSNLMQIGLHGHILVKDVSARARKMVSLAFYCFCLI